ncbi:hypothetical protein AOQ84DRAFT_348488 [Glonium stellatum]|uniref:Tyrosine specific protein phosphatases domain-containing protein n=1 Tax=Glonium stellatum TaxID=574774 RepID=A0A8E2JMP7_9PEZI|nr:hypothetical protein AOQ84DRAFT_348488 [Glonium stellatum]
MATPEAALLPSPPFFTVPNIDNLRDAALYPGGLLTSTGHRVRSGVLFRSAEVSRLDNAGWAQVKAIGVKTVFDLRSKSEVEKEDGMDVKDGWIHMMEQEGIERVWCPVFPDEDYSPERLAERFMQYMGETAEGFKNAYYDILTHAGPAFRTILLYLASLPPPSPSRNSLFLSNSPSAPIPPLAAPSNPPIGALIHCTAGKDRTGIFFGLILELLGVPREMIAAEYNLTEQGLLLVREKLVVRLTNSPIFRRFTLSRINGADMSASEFTALLKKEGPYLGGDKKVDGANEEEISPEVMEKGRAAVLRMIGAKKESMITALEMVEKEWGSAEGYIRAVCGLRDAEIEQLKTGLLVPIEAKVSQARTMGSEETDGFGQAAL